jgi:hypothetical protein
MIRMVRLYRSDKGIWRYEIERDGQIRWSSLRTKNERIARQRFEKMKRDLEGAGCCCLCGLPYERIGNNPVPLSSTGRCCDACDQVVIEARVDPKGLQDEVARVSQAIMRKSGWPNAMALAAICASRGPGLLAERRQEREKLEAMLKASDR